MPGEFPKAFAANPVQKLGEMALNINLPDAPTTSDGTYTVEFSAGKTIALPLVGQVGQIKKMGFTEDAAMGSVPAKCNMTKDYSAEDVYVLDWKADKIYHTKLGNQAKYFATARVNGCGVIIGGDRNAPTVVHANISPDSVYPENAGAYAAWSTAQDKAEHQTQLSTREKHDAWARYYANLAIKLRTDNRISSDTISVVDPRIYQADGSYGRIFGIRADNGDWTFYLNRDKGTNKAVTQEIWPTMRS
jgi:hypothetical protein